MMEVTVVGHTQDFEYLGDYVPKEIFMAARVHGFLVSLTYWNFDVVDHLINDRFSKKRHGLLYDPFDYEGFQYERFEREVGLMFKSLGGGVLCFVDKPQVRIFSNFGIGRVQVVTPDLSVYDVEQNVPSTWDDPPKFQQDHHRAGFRCSKDIVGTYAPYIRKIGM